MLRENKREKKQICSKKSQKFKPVPIYNKCNLYLLAVFIKIKCIKTRYVAIKLYKFFRYYNYITALSQCYYHILHIMPRHSECYAHALY